MNRFLIDLSRYNNIRRAQWGELIDRGLSGAIIKAASGNYATDSMTEEHATSALYHNLGYGLYHWPDPTQGLASIPSQVSFFGEQITKYKPRFVAWDAEHWWASWTEWRAKYVLKQNVQVRPLSSSYLYNFYRAYNHELKIQLAEKHNSIPVVAYSAQWFTRGYCRQLASVFQNEVLYYWNAYYFNWKDLNADKAMDWIEFAYWMDNLVKPSINGLPDGMTKWDIWQVGEITVKGYPTLDYNVITDSAFAALFSGQQVVSEPEPEIPTETSTPVLKFRVTATPYLNVRSSPKIASSNTIGQLATNTVLEVKDIAGSNAWIEYEPGKFACVELSGRRFMERIP